jgi:hypothetical protein
MNQNPPAPRGGTTITVSSLGLRTWQKLLLRLGLILPLMVGLQLVLVVLLMLVGLFPFELTEISVVQWGERLAAWRERYSPDCSARIQTPNGRPYATPRWRGAVSSDSPPSHP